MMSTLLLINMGDIVSCLLWGLCWAGSINGITGAIPEDRRPADSDVVKAFAAAARQEPTFLLLLAAVVWFVACKLVNGSTGYAVLVGAYIVFVVTYTAWVCLKQGMRFVGYSISLHFLAIAEGLMLTSRTLTIFGSTYTLTPHRQVLISILFTVILLRMFRVRYLQRQFTMKEVEAMRGSK